MYENIMFEKRSNGVAWLTLNRPERLNAFTEEMHMEMLQALKETSRDGNTRCLVITGEGRAFCAGEDIQGLGEETDHGEILRKRYNPIISAIANLEKPVIAAVNGICAGSGFSLALICDFMLVSEKASFVSSFMNIGLVPDSGLLYLLPRMVGRAKAMEIAVLGEKISAMEAKSLGIAGRLISEDYWKSEIEEFSAKLALMPTLAIGLVKRYMNESFSVTLDEMLSKEASAQRIAGLSKDHREGVAAFFEKRKPHFQGR
ncbi:enoyl-CoA hydratase-related protein [Bacillus sp. MUM 13]|uniref:enoyl-CoA hydratase-related protein n=1 Tax=Bacillus sp. MUM 13 TaxID=1678001 RepID=UPI0008F5ECD9|nr:enoyl-CoA hydratase-related protein [Bacillus sp. MUM 13]OIK14927.1 2-(1,2-epoxy-1,2-dihydrophenyl)acetyl-CoA isomerase [Bacillus sp. MUM 13]